jgi:hypothetical protein
VASTKDAGKMPAVREYAGKMPAVQESLSDDVYIEGQSADCKNEAKDAKRGFLWTKKQRFSC